MPSPVAFDDWNPEAAEPESGPFPRILAYAATGGTTLLFVAALLENVGFPIASDLVLGTMCVGAPRRSKKFVAAALVGAVVGTSIAFLTSGAVWESARLFANDHLAFLGYHQEGLKALHDEHLKQGWWSALFGGLRPFGMHRHAFAAGVFARSDGLVAYASATVVGQGVRYLGVAGFAAFFAELIDPSMRRRPGTWIGVFAALWASFAATAILAA